MDANLDDALAVFSDVRPRLFGIAYRMLGSATEAEDIVQETWLRWQGTDRTVVQEPAGVPGHDDHAPGDQRPAVRAGAP